MSEGRLAAARGLFATWSVRARRRRAEPEAAGSAAAAERALRARGSRPRPCLWLGAAASERERVVRRMSWFNASQLSSFAKQALSQAQKSIDRVLDIQAEESPWPDAVIPDYGDGERAAARPGLTVRGAGGRLPSRPPIFPDRPSAAWALLPFTASPSPLRNPLFLRYCHNFVWLLSGLFQVICREYVCFSRIFLLAGGVLVHLKSLSYFVFLLLFCLKASSKLW